MLVSDWFVELGWYFWFGIVFGCLFVLVFWWYELVCDDCYGDCLLVKIVDCWWIDYCVGCDYLGANYWIIVGAIVEREYGVGVNYLWFGAGGGSGI